MCTHSKREIEAKVVISPENVYIEAKKLEDKNLRLRTFLKIHADPDELNRQFLELHKELFTGYDCCKCGNCCRAFRPDGGFLSFSYPCEWPPAGLGA